MSLVKKYQNEAGLLLVWIASILIVNPVGNFPLNDDWSYALSVKNWIETGEFKLYNWGEMSLIAHVFWGYLFSSFTEFSFTALRLSTLVFGFFGLLGSYRLILLLNNNKAIAWLGALLSAFNPIYFSLSFSFMTDVPFMTLVLWSIIYLIKFQKQSRLNFLITAIFFMIWALLIRQLVLVIPLAWCISELINNRKNWKTAISPLIVVAICYFLYTQLMSHYGLLQGRYNDKLGLIMKTISSPELKLIRNIPGYFFVILAYLGFLLAPFHWLKWPNFKSKKGFIYIGFSIVVTGILVFLNKTIPCLDNVWVNFGVGPTTLYDFYGNFTSTPKPTAPSLLLIVITFLGVLSSSVWFEKAFNIIKPIWNKTRFNRSDLFALVCIVIYISPFILVGIYDRYLICLFPLVLIILGKNIKLKKSKLFLLPSIGLVVMIGVFSIMATHDYLSWNRVRWEVLRNLEKEVESISSIQGGAEYSAWNFFNENDNEWYNAISGEYKLTFSPIENHVVLSKHKYSRWLPGKGVLYLNKEN